MIHRLPQTFVNWGIESIESPIPHNKILVIGCIYRSPSSSLTEFLLNLDTILNQLSLQNKDGVLVGGFNINLLDIECKSYSECTNCFAGLGLEPLIHASTRCVRNGPCTLIDHALSYITPQLFSAILETDIIDHFLILPIFDACMPKKRNSQFTPVFHAVQFRETMWATDWSIIISIDEAEAALHNFSCAILKAVSSSTTTNKCKKRFSCPNNL